MISETRYSSQSIGSGVSEALRDIETDSALSSAARNMAAGGQHREREPRRTGRRRKRQYALLPTRK